MSCSEHYLIILGAGPQQVPVYEIAKRLNIRTIAVDYNPNSEARFISDDFVLADIKDSNQCIRELKKTGRKFSGVITCGAEVSPQVSRIASYFGLKGIPEDVAIKTTHKGLRLQALSDANIPTPKFYRLKKANKPDFEFPFIIKPSDSSGSRGVQQVTNEKEFQAAFREASSISSDGEVIAESFEFGTEISIEGFVLDGEITVTGLAERRFYQAEDTFPNFIEYEGVMPPTFSDESIVEAKRVFSDAVKALGIREGPSKGDLILTTNGVKVLEITSRSSPGFAAKTVPLATGVEVLEVLVRWAMNKPIDNNLLVPKWKKSVSHRYYKHSPGKIISISGLDQISDQTGVEYALILNQPKLGDVLEPMNYMNRLFYVMTVGNSPNEASRLASEALDSVEIIVKELL